MGTVCKLAGQSIVCLVAVALLPSHATTTAYQSPKPEPPSYAIWPAPIPTSSKIDVVVTDLPKGVTGKPPSFDGDSFYLSVLPKAHKGSLAAGDIEKDLLAHVLKALGYGKRLPEILTTPKDYPGVTLPPGNLARLAAETCKEVADAKYERFHAVCDAMQAGKTNQIAERVFGLAYGMTVAQFRADVERARIRYFFAQRPNGVPIEHSGVVATRWDGEAVTWIYGTLFSKYKITNSRRLNADEAIAAGQAQILKFDGIAGEFHGDLPKARVAELVLLPYGGVGAEKNPIPALRYAYRTLLFASQRVKGIAKIQNLSWMGWVDAQTGELLELLPQFAADAAVGSRWRRAPDTSVEACQFDVDPPIAGAYSLALGGIFSRIGDDIAIPASSPPVNFNFTPLVCGPPTQFIEVNAFAHLYSFRNILINAGTFPTFPELPVVVNVADSLGNMASYDEFGPGRSLLRFEWDPAFAAADCPNVVNVNLPGAQDATTLTHEFAHLSTPRLQERRLPTCSLTTCPVPHGRTLFHDFADAWAQAYASTPCYAGWSSKNQSGPSNSQNCDTHDENNMAPRLSSVDEPLTLPTAPKDHFPEKRALFTGPYPDMQIASTALWLTRQGMRSKCLPSGTPQYWVRINRALYDFGFLSSTLCTYCDRDIYDYLQDLLQQLTHQWATAGQAGGPPGFAHNGAHTTNKLLSAFARVGVFLIPADCIKGVSSYNAIRCPNGQDGGDAVVDVDDMDTNDDTAIDGIKHVEVDYIKRGGPMPTFRIWTGPRYVFDSSGQARAYLPSAATPSPCHSEFQVELASDAAFTSNSTTSTPASGIWRTVSTTSDPVCYGTWQPSSSQWGTLGGSSGDVKVYYRVRTRRTGLNEKISIQPGGGSYAVPPAYVVVNNAGQP